MGNKKSASGGRPVGDTIGPDKLKTPNRAQKQFVRAPYASFEIIDHSSRRLLTRPVSDRNGGFISNACILVRSELNKCLKCIRRSSNASFESVNHSSRGLLNRPVGKCKRRLNPNVFILVRRALKECLDCI